LETQNYLIDNSGNQHIKIVHFIL